MPDRRRDRRPDVQQWKRGDCPRRRLGHLRALGPGGQIIVGGSCDGSFALAQCTPGGTPDTSFNGSGTLTTDISGRINGIGVQTSGQIVVAGTCYDGCFDLARFNSDGSLDNTFGPNGNGQVSTSFASAGFSSAYADTIAIGPADTIVAGGDAYNPQNGACDAALAQYTSGGDLDTTFGTAGSGTVLTDIESSTAQARHRAQRGYRGRRPQLERPAAGLLPAGPGRADSLGQGAQPLRVGRRRRR